MLDKADLKDVFTNNLGNDDLNKLLSSTDINELSSIHTISDIDINMVYPNPYQPRKIFDKTKLIELAQSIIEHGLITPVLVNKTDKGYMLIAGERRFRASIIAGKTTIKAVVCSLSEKAIEELALLENIQREDLNVMEESRAYSQLMMKYNYTQEELAKRIGKSREYIANLLRLLKLPEKIQEEITENKISAGHARSLLSLKDEEMMVRMSDEIQKNKLNVRETEKMIKNKVKSLDKRDEKMEEMIEEIENLYHCEVLVTRNKVSFAFKNRDNLDAFLHHVKEKDSK